MKEIIEAYLNSGNKELRQSDIKCYLTSLLECDIEDVAIYRVTILKNIQNELKRD